MAKSTIVKKLTKDGRARMNLYAKVAKALEAEGLKVLGKSKKGLVLEGGTMEVAVVVKKVPVTEFVPLETAAEYDVRYKAYRAEKDAEAANEADAEDVFTEFVAEAEVTKDTVDAEVTDEVAEVTDEVVDAE